MGACRSSAPTRATSSARARRDERMARIAGVDIPREKRIEISLTYIFGIGRTRSAEICRALDISPDTRVRDITDDEVARIRNHIETAYKVEGDLRREIQQDIKRKMEIGAWQGQAHPHRACLQGRGRPAARDPAGHQAQDGDRRLAGAAPPQGPARPGPAHTDQ